MSNPHVNQHINPDVCYNILGNVGVKPEDILFLWSCRGISRSFKDGAERVFIQRHLPKMDLTIYLGMTYSAKHGKVLLSADFEFSHLLPEDRSRATFVDKQCAPEIRPMLTRSLRSEMEYGNPPHVPKILVHLRRHCNDTWIPGLELDSKKLEITCDWIGLVSEFLKEEAEVKRRKAGLVKSLESTMLETRDRMERGDISMEDSLTMSLDLWMDNVDSIQKQVRRERIRRNVWLNDGVKWPDTMIDPEEERAALKVLNDENFAAGMADPYSDEEEEEEGDRERDGDGGEEREEMEEDDEDDEKGDGEEEEDDEDAEGEEDDGEDEEAEEDAVGVEEGQVDQASRRSARLDAGDS